MPSNDRQDPSAAVKQRLPQPPTQQRQSNPNDVDRYSQAVQIHRLLWDPKATSVEYDGRPYPIVRRNTSTKQFAMVTFANGIRYVSQNLRKGSKWTDWVLTHDRRKLTWVFRGDVYSARIQSDAGRDEVFLLGPDRLAYQEEKAS